MKQKKLNRRDFLRLSTLAAAGTALAGCAGTPTPEVVEKVRLRETLRPAPCEERKSGHLPETAWGEGAAGSVRSRALPGEYRSRSDVRLPASIQRAANSCIACLTRT